MSYLLYHPLTYVLKPCATVELMSVDQDISWYFIVSNLGYLKQKRLNPYRSCENGIVYASLGGLCPVNGDPPWYLWYWLLNYIIVTIIYRKNII